MKKNSAKKTVKVKKKNMNELLQDEINKYNSVYDVLNASGTELHNQRERSVDLVDNIENIINSIANKPKSFEKDFDEISIRKTKFKDACEFSKKELDIAKKDVMGAGAGAAAGAGVAMLTPSAAMWVATTFGTASTGTAISTLSGAAATNAALAWIGGGALSIGGGGISAGTSFLALAGPIGWGIAGASILASVVLFATNKRKSKKEKQKEIESIKSNTSTIRKAVADIDAMVYETNLLRNELTGQYKKNIKLYGEDYSGMTDEQKYMLGSLVNNTVALSLLISKDLSQMDSESKQ